jgi:hypothetical protein
MKKDDARGITTFIVSVVSARAGVFDPAANRTAPARRSLLIVRLAISFLPAFAFGFMRNYATSRALSSMTMTG